MSPTRSQGPVTGTTRVDAVLNVVVSPVDPAKPAAKVVPRDDAAWLLDPLPAAEPASAELDVTTTDGNVTTGKDAATGPTPPTPILHAAAAEAPAARLAKAAARTGDRCMAGAERPTTAS
jgi:hypothetical protein